MAASAQMSGQYGQQGAAQAPPAGTSTQQSDQATPATAADVKAGAEIYDQKGGSVGKVESVEADDVVVSTGSVRVKVPLSSFAVGDKGLVIGMTKAELEAAAKKKEEKPK